MHPCDTLTVKQPLKIPSWTWKRCTCEKLCADKLPVLGGHARLSVRMVADHTRRGYAGHVSNRGRHLPFVATENTTALLLLLCGLLLSALKLGAVLFLLLGLTGS